MKRVVTLFQDSSLSLVIRRSKVTVPDVRLFGAYLCYNVLLARSIADVPGASNNKSA